MLKLEHVSESPGGLKQRQFGHASRISDSIALG